MNEWVIDIGNTDLVIGIWNKQNIDPQTFRLKIRLLKEDSDQLVRFLKPLVADHSLGAMTLSSVVPSVTDIVLDILQSEFGVIPNILNKTTYRFLPIQVLKPDEIGSDLVANALAVHERFKTYSIVTDFGTAMSFTTINPDGKIIGVCIAPGLQTAIKSLTSNTAQLFEVPIIQPESCLGQDTEHAIQAGITYGYDGLVKGIISTQENELKTRLNVVCTGGLSKIVGTLKNRIDHYMPFLTLEGLQIAGRYISRNKNQTS